MLDRAVRVAADALLDAWPGEEQKAWLSDEPALAARPACSRPRGDLLWTGGCHPVLLRAGAEPGRARLTGPAVDYWQDAGYGARPILGSGSPGSRSSSERLAEAYLAAGAVRPRPCPGVEWVLANRANALGRDHPGTIAGAARPGSRPGRREPVRRRDHRAGRRGRPTTSGLRGPDHLDTLAARDELAAAYRAAGQFGDAIPLYRRTLTDRERIQGARHPDTLTTRGSSWPTPTWPTDRVKDAIDQYKWVLADRERVLGQQHLDTIAARGNLAAAYHAAGRMASALQLYEQTWTGYDRVLGRRSPGHPDPLREPGPRLLHGGPADRRAEPAARHLARAASGCLPPGDRLTQVVRESLTNVAGASGRPG